MRDVVIRYATGFLGGSRSWTADEDGGTLEAPTWWWWSPAAYTGGLRLCAL